MINKFILFIFISTLSLIFYNIFINPLSRNNHFIYVVFIVTYIWWRRKNSYSIIQTSLVYMLSSYSLYIAGHHISNSTIYKYNYRDAYSFVIDPITQNITSVKNQPELVDLQSAISGVSIYIIIAFILIVDELFLNFNRDEEAIFFLEIELIEEDNQEWIDEIKERKERGEKIIAYSKRGGQALKKAIKLGIKDCFIDFLSYEEVEKKRIS